MKIRVAGFVTALPCGSSAGPAALGVSEGSLYAQGLGSAS